MPVIKCRECGKEILAPLTLLSKYMMISLWARTVEKIKSVHQCHAEDYIVLDYKGILLTDTDTLIDGVGMGDMMAGHNALVEALRKAGIEGLDGLEITTRQKPKVEAAGAKLEENKGSTPDGYA